MNKGKKLKVNKLVKNEPYFYAYQFCIDSAKVLQLCAVENYQDIKLDCYYYEQR